jgi:hypothetical protein
VLTIIVVALIVALFAAALIVIARRQASSRRTARGVETSGRSRGPPLPVVLVHGFRLRSRRHSSVRFDYFRGIIEAPGRARVPRACVGTPLHRCRRAKQLVAAIEHCHDESIVARPGRPRRAYALRTSASTARALADASGRLITARRSQTWCCKRSVGWAHKLLRVIVPSKRSVLSTESLARFNREVPDAPGVRYACVVGGMHRADSIIPLPLIAAHAYLKRVAGTNDGIVPVSSQYWGEVLAEIEADHFAQIGWRVSVRGTFDALGLYAFVVARLGDGPPIVVGQNPAPNEATNATG